MMQKFDATIFNGLHAFSGQGEATDFLIAFFAEYIAYLLLAGVVVFLLLKKRYKNIRDVALVLVSPIIARFVFAEPIRLLFPKDRPFIDLDFIPIIPHEVTSAFPSGHASVFFALAFALWRLDRRWGTVYLIFAILMGFGRVIGGVHWPLDIIAGAIVGYASVAIVFLSSRRLSSSRHLLSSRRRPGSSHSDPPCHSDPSCHSERSEESQL